MKTIILVGAGNLGYRYLEGIARLQIPLNLYVVDQSVAAINRASSIKFLPEHSVCFQEEISNLPSLADLIILASTASGRVELIQNLYKSVNTSFWIIEKVLAQSVSELNQLSSLFAGSRSCWINTPRRLMTWHQAIKRQMNIQPKETVHASISGGKWGLACNSVHFIDLLSWWTNSLVSSICVTDLDDWHESKRKGYYEVFGKLRIEYANGSTLDLACNPSDQALEINVQTPSASWVINETAGVATTSSGLTLRGHTEYQSILTTPLVQQILISKTCDLTPLEESINHHHHLISALSEHWALTFNEYPNKLPIT